MNSLFNKLLKATNLITERGRWPGQCYIVGSTTKPAPKETFRPLRWPGQWRISGGESRENPLDTPPKSVWNLERLSLALIRPRSPF